MSKAKHHAERILADFPRGTGRTTNMLWAAGTALKHNRELTVDIVVHAQSSIPAFRALALDMFSPKLVERMYFVAVQQCCRTRGSLEPIRRIGKQASHTYVDHHVYYAELAAMLPNLIEGLTKYD